MVVEATLEILNQHASIGLQRQGRKLFDPLDQKSENKDFLFIFALSVSNNLLDAFQENQFVLLL